MKRTSPASVYAIVPPYNLAALTRLPTRRAQSRAWLRVRAKKDTTDSQQTINRFIIANIVARANRPAATAGRIVLSYCSVLAREDKGFGLPSEGRGGGWSPRSGQGGPSSKRSMSRKRAGPRSQPPTSALAEDRFFPNLLPELRARPPRRRGGNGNRDPKRVVTGVVGNVQRSALLREGCPRAGRVSRLGHSRRRALEVGEGAGRECAPHIPPSLRILSTRGDSAGTFIH